MNSLAKNEQLNQLFDLYESLLTNKQRLYFKLYYQEDYSLNEISELYHISRNAIFDHLKKTEEHLLLYEEKLKLFDRKTKRAKLLDQLPLGDIVEKLRKLDE
ncbi:MAG: hypothetical protein WC964_02150 [Acholeplasmataceae bacterium]